MTWRPALWLVAALVIAVDQATKQWALSSLTPGVKQPLVGELLQIQLVFNSGAAFSFMSGHTWILTVVVTAVTAALIWFGRRARSRSAVVIFGLGIGGAVGNLLDRLLRDPGFPQGHVVDMINYADQFVGNVADVAIVVAAGIAIIRGLLGHPILGTPQDQTSGDADATPSAAPADSEVASS